MYKILNRNIQYLKHELKKEVFICEVKNKFEALSGLMADETLEQHCHTLQEIWRNTCIEVLGRKTKEHKEWLSAETWGKNPKTERAESEYQPMPE